MRVLLTNDDGYQASGLRALARQLATTMDVTVVAPEKQRSATSHSVTLHKPLRLERVRGAELPEYDAGNVTAYSCSGVPTDCVMLGIMHLMQENLPDLVISGVNDGLNVAQDLTYSGTVGGALEAAVLGVPGIAASLAGQRSTSFVEAAEIMHTIVAMLTGSGIPDGLEQVAAALGFTDTGEMAAGSQEGAGAGWLPEGLSTTLCLNVNIPDLSLNDLRGLRWTISGHRDYEDVIRAADDPSGRPYYWFGGTKVLGEDVPGSDTEAISQGFVSITPLTYDITNQKDYGKLTSWFTERR